MMMPTPGEATLVVLAHSYRITVYLWAYWGVAGNL